MALNKLHFTTLTLAWPPPAPHRGWSWNDCWTSLPCRRSRTLPAVCSEVAIEKPEVLWTPVLLLRDVLYSPDTFGSASLFPVSGISSQRALSCFSSVLHFSTWRLISSSSRLFFFFKSSALKSSHYVFPALSEIPVSQIIGLILFFLKFPWLPLATPLL